MRDFIVYDAEIKKAIRSKSEDLIPGIEYCGGWKDYGGMGISCMGVYDSWMDQYRVFCDDNIQEFKDIMLIDSFVKVGFNNIGFDDNLIIANNIQINQETHYDILRQVWIASGLAPTFEYPSHTGFGLDAIVKSNFKGEGKIGHGEIAPVDYQNGNFGSLIDYCINDVRLTVKLLRQILNTGFLICPKTGKALKMNTDIFFQ